jgi:hypothetical protein
MRSRPGKRPLVQRDRLGGPPCPNRASYVPHPRSAMRRCTIAISPGRSSWSSTYPEPSSGSGFSGFGAGWLAGGLVVASAGRCRKRGGRARPGTFRERVDPCQHCGPRHDGRMRTASAATFRVDRALSLPPAARRRAFCRRHAAARSKAAAAGSRGSRAQCIHRLSRARSWVLIVKATTYPWRPVATHG